MSRQFERVCALTAVLYVLAPSVASAQTLAAAVLPSGRSVTVGATATAFASIINTGSATATSCKLTPATQVAATFSYQTTDSATNAPTGSPNTPVNIPAGGTQSFVFSLTPTSAFAPTDVNFQFICANTSAATVISGVNTLLLSASATAVSDVIATVATTTNDGVAHVPGVSGTGFFATAAVNIGAPGGLSVAPVVLGGAQVQASVCETNSATGACLAPPSPSVTSTVSTSETRTYSVFLAGQGVSVAPDFAAKRVRLEFKDAGGAVRGATSVAVCSVGAAGCDVLLPYVAVNTDVTKNTYPTTYTTVTMKSAVDVCNIDSDKVFYPQNWNGNKPLPAVTGAPLNPTFLRIANLKDILPQGSLPQGCSNPGNFTEFSRTLIRLKAMHVDAVTITQWHWAFINPDGSFAITGDTGGALSDADVTTYVQMAHAAGIKVMMANQIQGFVTVAGNGVFNCCITTPQGNAQNWARWLTAFGTYMQNRAAFFQSLGVDYWEMGCNSCVYSDSGDGSLVAQQQFAAAYPSILAAVTPIFHGTKYVIAPPWLLSTPNFLSGLDMIGQALFYSGVPNETTMTVASAKTAFQASGILPLLNAEAQTGKPIMVVSVGMQSRANAMSLPGYMEETGCTNNIGSLVFGSNCIQLQTSPDFALQAIFLEAQMELIAAANLPAGSAVNLSDYWQTDFMSDKGPTFPDIGYTVRNKPAEGITQLWFAK